MKYTISDEHEGHKFEWVYDLRPNSRKQGPLITCIQCRGSSGRHFGMIDEPTDCSRCNNTGKIIDPYFVWKPEPPKELLDGLMKVWRDYWNKQENESFVLTPPKE